MKKKLFAMILCLVMIISLAASLSEVSFAEAYDINKINTIVKLVDGNTIKYYGIKTYNNLDDHVGVKHLYEISKTVYDEVASKSFMRFARVDVTYDANGNETSRKEVPFKLSYVNIKGNIDDSSFTGSVPEQRPVFTEIYFRHHMAFREGFVNIAPYNLPDQQDYTYLLDLKKDWTIEKIDGFYSGEDYNAAYIFFNAIIEGNSHTLSKSSVVPPEDKEYLIMNLGGSDGDVPERKIKIRNLTVDGSSKYACMVAYDKVDLTLENVKIRNGKHLEYESGGISLHKNTKLTMDAGCEISNCVSKYGGAIRVRDKSIINIEGSKFLNNSSDGGGAVAVIDDKSTVNIKGATFENNKSNGLGGAIYSASSITIDKDENNTRTIFKKNYAKGIGGAIYLTKSTTLKINNSDFEENSTDTDGGAIYVNWKAKAKIEGTNFIKNSSKKTGGAISFEFENANESTLLKCHFEENTSNLGGAVYTGKGSKIKVEESNFIKNNATVGGGAIYTSDKKYASSINPATDYQNLDIDENTKFIKNKASGYFNPPENVDKLTNIKSKVSSFTGTKKINPDSPLNNYDINYKRDIVVTYDPNDGNEVVEEKYQEQSIDNYEIKSPTNLNFTNTAKFLGWSEDKDSKNPEYHAKQKVNIKGNLYLYAIWEEAKPAPSTLILTLDENYAHGKITDYEVMQGEFIDPYLYTPRRRGYVFEAWSYSRDRMREVRKGDQVYTNTVLYAMWKKAKAEEAPEEPEEIKGLTHKAYIFGYPDGTVRPNGKITRAEAAAMLARLLDIEATGSADAPSFPDTPSSWYNKAINAVVARGIMQGYPDGTFRPNSPITRAEFTKMIAVIDNKPYGTAPFADVIGHWAERPIGSEYQAGRILGYPDGTFRPDNHITRCEAAVILNKIFERNFDAMSLMKCKNPQMIKYFIDLDASFWGYNDMVEATNDHDFVRRSLDRVPEDWLLIK